MDVNTGTPAVETETDDDDNEYSRGKYIYPAGIISKAAKRMYRNAIRNGKIAVNPGVNVQVGAEINFRTKTDSHVSTSERKLLQALRSAR